MPLSSPSRPLATPRLLPVVSAAAADRNVAADEVCAPALSHLPAPERRLVGQLLPPGLAELPPASSEAVSEGGGGGSGMSLSNRAGKPVAKLRSFALGWGAGLALCRLEAFTDDLLLNVRGEGGSQTCRLLFPHRPSWWPERVITSKK